ncbi:Bifunctional protein FolD protein [archaeon HR06]|nr:Bifunctional protein FolD protein [archaeon HR06]
MVKLMSAKEIFQREKEVIKREVEKIKKEGYTPGLAAVITSDDPLDLETARFFVSKKREDCREVGIYFEVHEMLNKPQGEVLNLMEKLNKRDDISGIIFQKPLAKFLDEDKIFSSLDPTKDVDGLTPYNKGKLSTHYDFSKDLLPCTAAGIVELLSYYDVKLEGLDVVIVGRSDLVGRPLRIMLEDLDATVTCLHRKSKNILDKISRADMIVCAAGRPPELYSQDSFKLYGDMVKEGCIVINVGIRIHPESKKMYFDVDFDSVAKKAKYITPNLGGVGLMTRLRLLKNIVISSKLQLEKVKP